jgi:hypothetical protein
MNEIRFNKQSATRLFQTATSRLRARAFDGLREMQMSVLEGM